MDMETAAALRFLLLELTLALLLPLAVVGAGSPPGAPLFASRRACAIAISRRKRRAFAKALASSSSSGASGSIRFGAGVPPPVRRCTLSTLSMTSLGLVLCGSQKNG